MNDPKEKKSAASDPVGKKKKGRPVVKIRSLTDKEKKRIQQILKEWTTDHLQILDNESRYVESGIPEDLKNLEFINVNGNGFPFILRQLWAPWRYIKIRWRIRSIFKKMREILKDGAYSRSYLGKWQLYFELRLPKEQRYFFRDSLLPELISCELATPFHFFPFLAGQLKKKSKWSRMVLIETAISVVAALSPISPKAVGDSLIDSQSLKILTSRMIDLTHIWGLKIAGQEKNWRQTTRGELSELMGYQAQERFPSFLHADKKVPDYSITARYNAIYRLLHHLSPVGVGRTFDLLQFLRLIVTENIDEENASFRLMAQIADILDDLTRLVDKEIIRFTDVNAEMEKTRRKYSIIGKMVDILVAIPRENWNLYIQRQADKFIRGMIWWDSFVPDAIWDKLKAKLDDLPAADRLETWYLVGFWGAALLDDQPGPNKFLYESVTRICQEQGLKSFYPASLQKEFELPKFTISAIYSVYLPDMIDLTLELVNLGFQPTDDWINYILMQDYPLIELRMSLRLFEKFNKNLALYVELTVYLGKFLNDKLTIKIGHPISGKLLKDKMSIIMVFVSIADNLLYKEAVRFTSMPDMNSSEMRQLLDRFFAHQHPVNDLIYLLEEIRQRKMIDRLDLIRVTLVLEQICRRKHLVLNRKQQRALRGKFTDLVRSLPTNEVTDQFVENGLQDLMELVLKNNPLRKLDALIEAVQGLKYPDFILRFLTKIVPMIIASFDKDLELTKENLQWAVSIYNKNADETAIMEELEDKMKGQIKSVGKRLRAIPHLIQELAKGWGASDKDIHNLVLAMRKISIKFTELELLSPEHKVGMAKITMQTDQKRDDRSITQIVNRFMREGISNIITSLLHHQTALPLFLAEDGVIHYLDKIMPIDTISQEDVTVALGEKPILFEERGFVFISEILPMSIEAVEGDPDKLRRIFDMVAQTVRRDILASDLGVRYLQNCAKQLRRLGVTRRLRQSIEKIMEWKPAISVGNHLKKLHAKNIPGSKEDELEKILDIFEREKQYENAIVSSKKALAEECGKVCKAAHLNHTIEQRLVHHLQIVMSHLGSEQAMEDFINAMDDGDPTFREWNQHISSLDEFIHWYRRLSAGKISSQLEWVRETNWYHHVKKDYWKFSYKYPWWGKIVSLFRKFENVDKYDKVIELHFKQWFEKKVHLLGRLLINCIALGDEMVNPMHLLAIRIQNLLTGDITVESERIPARVAFLQVFQKLTADLTPRDRIFAEGEHFTLEDRLVSRVIPDLNRKVGECYLEDRLAQVPSEFEAEVRRRLTDRLGKIHPTENKSTLQNRFEFLEGCFDHYLMSVIVLTSVGNPEKQRRIEERLTQNTWLFGGVGRPRTIEREIDVFSKEFLTLLKELWQNEGVLSKEQVAKIEKEMPEEYQESIDALQILMTWTMDPNKIILLGEIDEQPILMKAISEDGELMSLLDSLADQPSALSLVKQMGGRPDLLKEALKKL
ncbi:MAG: hypothetical protein B6244_02520 [Candidatus Cloacimonetes bacterium 4572_55]|nr:MAG: hypothetical protein B6244_02520 [Candidatus Cloacimonetes bacterium 4572_55]